MHKSQLEFFENLITNFTYQEVEQEKGQKKALADYSAQQIIQEKIKFLRFIGNLKFEIKDEQEIKWLVNAYHEKIAQLLKDVDQLNSTPHDEHLNEIFHQVYSVLVELLSNIESTFTRYLDLCSTIPVHYENNLRRKIAAKVDDFGHLFEYSENSNPLTSIIHNAFIDFLENEQTGKTTYLRIHYLSTLIHSLCDQAEPKDIEDVLFYLNFNSPDFVNFYTQRLSTEAAALPKNERLEKYSMALKEIRQRHQKPALIYNSLYPQLKDQLEAWINEEIYFIKEVSYSGGTPLNGELAKWNGYKIETAFSVPQFAYIIKLFSDMGIFTNHNKTEMIEFFSTFFNTAKTQSISAGSLRKNFYNEDASVSDAVRNVLFSMIHRSKGHT